MASRDPASDQLVTFKKSVKVSFYLVYPAMPYKIYNYQDCMYCD